VLNDAQHRHLSITMRVAEERLRSLQRLMRTGGETQGLLEVDDDLTPGERSVVAAKLAELLRCFADLGTQFSLSREWCSLRRTLAASLSITWADIQNVKAAALGAYGEVDPRLRDQLDPLLDRSADGNSWEES
jgi:hypothetical protein